MDVIEALDKLREGEIEADEVREMHSDIDGIERSISVAIVQREQTMDEDEFKQSFEADFELE
ncbi:hypothetical protein Hbl1158_00555 [Halobaculum sp. CBA1158]|uniref:hypothetical protein n=1 Tax=Halobaculum sp. CBA1158 TaxID=2904243 RepID=UPI001F1C91E9|nr:hypothetical protein [Halobaculum sp. CBA1158]UIO99898.1 hypothetical protein Hbl1158_00555 [Halobaculum sp. CBA1158]